MKDFAGGWFGKLLRINLTEQTTKVEEIDPAVLYKFVGGAALGAKILYDKVPPGIDPLSPENKLIFAVGPLTGTETPCASRLNLTTKSPLTGALANSLSGGFFPVEMKWTGFDAIIIEGKSPEPVYLLVKDEKVEIKKAARYWGLHTQDTQTYLKEDLNDHNIRIACIGPAGENLSLMSCIINECRAMGRKGVGAVMGSKNLKAIAVRGTGEVPIANPKKFKETIKEFLKHLRESELVYPVFSKTGSSLAVGATSALGFFPAKNWQDTGVEDLAPYLDSNVFAQYGQTRNSCYRCPVACSQVRMVKKGPYEGISTEGPEYETIYALGSVLGIKDPPFIIAADRLCDELGLDTISAGVTIGMAMELYEKGIFTSTNGLELKFGNQDSVLTFLRMIAYKEGFAKIFADGAKKAGQAIGKGAEYYAMEVKGLELPAYDVRGAKAHGVNYATAYTGADHNRGYAAQEVFGIPIPYPVERLEIKGKGILAKWNQDFCGCYDVATLCEFPTQMGLMPIAQKITADLLSDATGWDFTEQSVWQLGERLNNLCRMFNVREGFSRKDDCLPRRLMEEPIKDGLSKGEMISQQELDFMLDEYYEARGWDKNGIPTPAKLHELGLEDTIKDLPSNA